MYLSKDDLSEIIDNFTLALDYAKNRHTADESVVVQLRKGQGIMEEKLPTTFYMDRDHDIDELCENVKNADTVKERRDHIIDFIDKLIDKIYTSDEIDEIEA